MRDVSLAMVTKLARIDCTHEYVHTFHLNTCSQGDTQRIQNYQPVPDHLQEAKKDSHTDVHAIRPFYSVQCSNGAHLNTQTKQAIPLISKTSSGT